MPPKNVVNRKSPRIHAIHRSPAKSEVTSAWMDGCHLAGRLLFSPAIRVYHRGRRAQRREALRRVSCPTRSIWPADRGGDRRRAGHRPRHRRALPRFRRRGRDLGPRQGAWRRRPRRSSASAARSIAVAVDVTESRRGRARARRDPQGASAASTSWSTMPASPGQNATTWDYPVEEWRAGDVDQSRRPVPLLPRDRARHDRAELRPHRQHRLDRRQGRQPERAGLFGVEGRRDRADQVARQGTRRPTTSRSTASRRRRRRPRSSTR